MSRAVDKYGINIRNAALQTELTRLGIDATVNSLSQADKAMLRTIVILNSSEYAWGDLADTISQPANQIRVLKNQISMLGRALGNIFLPIVAKVLPYLNQLVYALRELAEWIVKLLGYEDFDWGNATGADNSAISDLLDDTEGVADNLDKAADNAKKFKNQLQGFDKLNNLTTTDTSDTDGGKGTGGINTGLLDTALDDALSRYQQKWDEAFENMNQSFSTFADNVKKAFKKGGLYGVGRYFAKTITKGLNSIPWDNIKEKAGQAGEAVADFLNGLTDPNLFKAAGNAFSQGINTVFSFLYGFVKKYNFKNLGQSIAAGLNEANAQIDWKLIFDFAGELGTKLADFVNGIVEDTNWKDAGKTIANFFSAVTKVAKNFVENVKWGDIGKAIGNFINGLLTYDWAGLGSTISTSIKGILTSIINALKTVEWEKVGKSIAEFIKNIDWGGIVWKLGELASSLFNAIVEAIKGLWEDANWLGKIAIAIGTVIAAVRFTGAAKTAIQGVGTAIAKLIFGDEFASKLKTLLSNKITETSSSETVSTAANGAGDKVGKMIGKAVVAFAVSEIGISLGNEIDVAINGEDPNTKNFFDDKPILKGVLDIVGLLGPIGASIKTGVTLLGNQNVLNVGEEEKLEKQREVYKQLAKDLGVSEHAVQSALASSGLKKYANPSGKEYDYERALSGLKDIISPGQLISGGIKVNVDATETKNYKKTMKQATSKNLKAKTTVEAKTAKDKTTKSTIKTLNTTNYNALLTGTGKKTKELISVSDMLNTKGGKSTLTGYGKDGGRLASVAGMLSTVGITSTLTGYGKDGGELENVSKWLNTGNNNSTLTGFGKDGGKLDSISKLLKTNDKTSTLTGFGKDGGGLLNTSSLLKTNGKTSTLTGKGKEDNKKTLSGVVDSLTIGAQTATLTAKAQWAKDSNSDVQKILTSGLTAGLSQNLMMIYAGTGAATKKKANGGIYTNGIWKSITGAKRYASGGLPNIGSLFWAGENGAEIVGNTTRGTEVLNQSQIAQAMAESMESANAQQNAIMRQQNQLLREEISVLHAILEKTGITDGDIFQSVRRSNDNYARINGHGAFAY